MRQLAAFVLVLLALGGCAGQRVTSGVVAPEVAPDGSLAPHGDPQARMALSDLPPLQLPPPTTRPTDDAPLEAIALFAQARDAQAAGSRQTAVNLLEEAIRLDPYSFELHYALAEVQAVGTAFDDRSISSLRTAVGLVPQHLAARIELGRQLLLKGELDSAIEQLRLARLSDEYESDEDLAAVTDFFLARALQRRGLDRAALDAYADLLDRLRKPTLSVRRNPELAVLIRRPQIVYGEIAALYERNGQWEQAVSAHERAVERDADDFDAQSRLVRALARSSRRDQAAGRTLELVRRFHASSA